MHPKVTRLLALWPILFSTGCASSPPPAIEVRTIVIAPDPQLLTCAPAPKPPATPATMEGLLVYLNRLYFAGADCRARLAGVKEAVDAAIADALAKGEM